MNEAIYTLIDALQKLRDEASENGHTRDAAKYDEEIIALLHLVDGVVARSRVVTTAERELAEAIQSKDSRRIEQAMQHLEQATHGRSNHSPNS